MTIHLNEPAVTSLLTRLETTLNGHIDAVNAEELSPAYPIEYPQLVLDYIPSREQMVSFPIVAIEDGPTSFTDDNGWGATGVHTLTVVAFVIDPDPRALAWRLRRYAQAITRCMVAGRNMDNGGWGLVFRGVQPGPTLTRRESPRQFMSFIAATVEIRDNQDT